MATDEAVRRELNALQNVTTLLKVENVAFAGIIAIVFGVIASRATGLAEGLSAWLVVVTAIGAWIYFLTQGHFRFPLSSDSDRANVVAELHRKARLLRRAPYFVLPLVASLLFATTAGHAIVSIIILIIILLGQTMGVIGAREF